MICSLVIGRAHPLKSMGFFSWLKILFLAALTFGSAASPAFGQTPNTGTITGRVLNANNGTYLNNARVTLEGSDKTVFTNEYGEYILNDVPAGEAKVRAFFSGREPKLIPITVTAGQTVTQDIRFGAAESDSDTVKLDTFTIAAQRDTDVASIAVNEQRFAPNIKTVIETSAFGDIAEGNVGEFLKYLPGVTVDYVAADVRTVNVRGFGAAFTSVYLDGFRMASAASGSSIRAFEFEQVSINNAARVEVIKEPTPDFPADALGGSVNLISKNAFEREGAAFNYRAYLNANSEDVMAWKQTSGPKNKDSYKVLPGFDFDYTLPVTKSLGFVITGLSSNQFNEQHRSQNQWNFAQGAGAPQGAATPTTPYMQQYQMQDGPKNSFRDSLSLKADWKIGPGQSLWAMYQVNYYSSFFGNRNITWDAGTSGAPATAGGVALTYDPILRAVQRAADPFGTAHPSATNMAWPTLGRRSTGLKTTIGKLMPAWATHLPAVGIETETTGTFRKCGPRCRASRELATPEWKRPAPSESMPSRPTAPPSTPITCPTTASIRCVFSPWMRKTSFSPPTSTLGGNYPSYPLRLRSRWAGRPVSRIGTSGAPIKAGRSSAQTE